MQFTGSELTLKRSFYTQTGEIGFSMACIVDNTTGLYKFGVTGSNGAFEFRMQSGRIYYENTFLHAYQPDEEFLIEAQMTENKANIIKDSAPLAYNIPRTTGFFDYFYFTRESASLGGSFSVNVSGSNIPIYEITDKGYLLTSGQTTVTGYFLNDSAFPIKVFNSEIQATANYNFGALAKTINAQDTGVFVYTGDYNAIDFSAPIVTTFNTNFADIEILFSIVDARSFNRFVYLTAPTEFDLNNENVLQRIVSWENYSGGFVSNAFNTELIFSLSYLEGSGSFNDSSFGGLTFYSGTVSNNVVNFGTLTGEYVFNTGNENSTGIYTIPISAFAWATGQVAGFFSGWGTGLGTGIEYTGRTVSAFTGAVTGFIFDGSGTLLFLSSVTGLPVGPAYSLDYPIYMNATGFINISGMSLGSSFFIGSFNDPIVRGVQFMNETGLIAYLSGAPQHLVNGIYNGGIILLTAREAGLQGNSIQVQEFQCAQGAGFFAFTPYLTGGAQSGTTGNLVVSQGVYTGAPGFTITGSGFYTKTITGLAEGTFSYTRTFTGAWDFYTGLDPTSLVSLKIPGSFNGNTISGSGTFSANSQMIMQIVNNTNSINIDKAKLIISGREVLNPITQTITTYA